MASPTLDGARKRAPPLCVRSMERLDRFIEDRLDAIAIWIYNEGGVVVLAVVWP